MIPGITASTRRVTGGGGGEVLPPGTAIGDFVYGGYYAGNLLIEGTMYALLVADVSADITGENSRWKTTNTDTPNTDHQTDGVANTNAMIAAGIADHPAANHCVNYNGGGYTDWYMPARDELNVIYQNLGFNRPNCPPNFQIGGPQAFFNAWYWASTQFDPGNGWRQHFNDGSQFYNTKTHTGQRVRPVRRLQFNP